MKSYAENLTDNLNAKASMDGCLLLFYAKGTDLKEGIDTGYFLSRSYIPVGSFFDFWQAEPLATASS